MLSSPWRKLWHVFFTYTSFIFFQVLVMVALKASTNGCGFFHTICSTYANMLHSRKFKSGDLGGHKSLPQKLGMFSLRYSRVFLPYDKVLHLLATHNLHHKVLFIHRSTSFYIGITTNPFIWALSGHWMPQPQGPWTWQSSLSRRHASDDQEHPALI